MKAKFGMSMCLKVFNSSRNAASGIVLLAITDDSMAVKMAL